MFLVKCFIELVGIVFNDLLYEVIEDIVVVYHLDDISDLIHIKVIVEPFCFILGEVASVVKTRRSFVEAIDGFICTLKVEALRPGPNIGCIVEKALVLVVAETVCEIERRACPQVDAQVVVEWTQNCGVGTHSDLFGVGRAWMIPRIWRGIVWPCWRGFN